MGIKKVKISELPLSEVLEGLFTIGVDKLNRSVKVSLGFLKTAADKATVAAMEANTAKDNADNAATAAIHAADNADAQAIEARNKATEAGNATLAAQQTTSEARATIVRLEELEQSLVGPYKLIPTGLILDYPGLITRGNTVPKIISYSLLPIDTGRNVLFLGDDNAVSVLPDGNIIVRKPGISKIHVIPTENTTLYRTIEITVAEPTFRKVKASSLRLMGNGAFRLT